MIKNRDGTPYKGFSKPNQIMTTQTLWPKDEPVYFHNKFGKKHINTSSVEQVIKRPDKITEVIATKQEVVEPAPRRVDYPSDEVFEVWCLPCLAYEEKVDELYGEKHGKVTYGDKFLFRARILQLEDLFIQIVAVEKINPHSILYPKIKSKRWWKVTSVIKVDGFNVMNALISDYQPSFSDQN